MVFWALIGFSAALMAGPQEDLFTAASQGNVAAIQKSIKLGANVNAKDDKGQLKPDPEFDGPAQKPGWTPLIMASIGGHAEAVKLLLAAGAKTEVKDRSGETALWHACAEGKTEVVRLLIAAKADVNAKDQYDQTPLSVAQAAGHKEVIQLLKSAGAR